MFRHTQHMHGSRGGGQGTRMLANANLMNVLPIKLEKKVWVTYLQNTHCWCFSLSYIFQPSVKLAYFPSNLY